MLIENCKNHLGNLGVDGLHKININRIGCENKGWIHLAQDTNTWRSLVNTFRTLGLHKWRGIS